MHNERIRGKATTLALTDRHQAQLFAIDCSRTDETAPSAARQATSVPAQTDWSQADFVAWLDGLKKDLNLGSDYKLAELLGISHSMISSWRSGRTKPSMDTLMAIAERRGIAPQDLWVLAGLVDPRVVGVDPEASRRALRDATRPAGFEMLLRVYDDERMTDDDRADLDRQAGRLARTFLGELDERQPPTGRRRIG
jgi:transcriptional regulator with XRE-family HTH domain